MPEGEEAPEGVFLIARSGILSAGIRRILEEASLAVIGEASILTQAALQIENPLCRLVLAEVAAPGSEDTRLLGHLARRRPLIVISDEERDWMGIGVQGRLPTTASGPQLLAAVTIVASGGTCWLRSPALPEGSKAIVASPLSARESSIIAGLARGCTNEDLARALHLSVGSVKRELSRLFRRYSVTDRTELVARLLAASPSTDAVV